MDEILNLIESVSEEFFLPTLVAFSKAYQSYQDNERIIMMGSV